MEQYDMERCLPTGLSRLCLHAPAAEGIQHRPGARDAFHNFLEFLPPDIFYLRLAKSLNVKPIHREDQLCGVRTPVFL